MERLQKYMATCGVASRRNSEKMIADGRVSVNGNIVIEMGFKVSKNDKVCVDGKLINKVTTLKYYVMNKPRNVICSVSDPQGRKTVISILPEELSEYRLFPVGRLDYDTKGVLLLTNDGDFMNELVGPNSSTENGAFPGISEPAQKRYPVLPVPAPLTPAVTVPSAFLTSI